MKIPSLCRVLPAFGSEPRVFFFIFILRFLPPAVLEQRDHHSGYESSSGAGLVCVICGLCICTSFCFILTKEEKRLLLHIGRCIPKKITMSDTGAKSSQPLAVKQEKDVTPKRGRGRPRKQTQEPTGAPVPKRPRGRPRGSKNKVSSSKSGRKSGGAGGAKPRGRPKKLKTETTGAKKPRGRPRKREKVEQEEEEEHASQESSEEAQ